MNVEIEQLSSAEIRVTVHLPLDEVDRSVDQQLYRLAQTTTAPGFRKGKIPKNLVRQRHGETVRQKTILDMIDLFVRQKLQESPYNPISPLRLESQQDNKESNHCEVLLRAEVLPEIKTTDITGLKTVSPVVEVTAQDLDAALERWQKEYQLWLPVDRAAQESDRLVVNWDIGSKNSNAVVSIGRQVVEFDAPDLHPQIREACLGAAKGQRVKALVESAAQSPEEDDHIDADVGDEPASHTHYLDILEVQEAVPGKHTLAFLGRLDVKSEQDENFREKALKHLKEVTDSAVNETKTAQVINLIAGRNEFILPHSLVLATIKKRLMDETGCSPEQADHYIQYQVTSDEYTLAYQRTLTQLIVAKIGQDRNLQVDEQKALDDRAELEARYASNEEMSDSDRQVWVNYFMEMRDHSRMAELLDETFLTMLDESNCEQISMSLDEFHQWAREFDVIAHQDSKEKLLPPAAGEASRIVGADGQPLQSLS